MITIGLRYLRLEEELPDIEEEELPDIEEEELSDSDIEAEEYMPQQAMPEPVITHEEKHSDIKTERYIPQQAEPAITSSKGIVQGGLTWLGSLFSKHEMEISLIGLQNAGKTSLVNAVDTGRYSEDMVHTVGFSRLKVTKGNVTITMWDLGGQPRFRSIWERYCRGVSALVYVVDAADKDNLSISKDELYDLLSKPSLNGIPLLVLGNKIDNPGALSKQELIDQIELKSITDREVHCFMVSCKNLTNIDLVIDWLTKHAKSKN